MNNIDQYKNNKDIVDYELNDPNQIYYDFNPSDQYGYVTVMLNWSGAIQQIAIDTDKLNNSWNIIYNNKLCGI